ncbi:oxidoreductase [Colletotrichum karsti]|uniref:Oxidoreductase n=1 Tax=Colletotrichum karsti TaxID=1095194 RepID=A0A9P6IF96_9PEZI|nr:oxidoreductase [Colletotrichum karsti]KAF9881764.1 oxidoreductase [Colletotrichum karsti]
MPLKILISGAGVAGPALSAFLLRANPSHSITIVERSLALRKGGQQIDLRGQGIPVMRKLGLLDKVKERAVAEDGIAFVDASSGRQWAIFGRNDSGQGRQAFSSEYEIMRRDLVDVLYGASLDEGRRGRSRDRGQGGLKYKFGTYATGIRQFESGAQVSFCDGSTEDFDLVVGADGQSSKTRRLVFGQEASDAAFKSLGVNFAYFRIPREQSDNATAQASFSSKKRFMAIRTGDRPVAQGYLGVKADIPELTNSTTQSASTQKDLWAQIFEGAGWKSERLIRDMLATDDFYAHKLGQVKMDTWSKGRVVLLGDAGYCPSPMTGMGTACGMVGAYVLAGEISRFGHGSNIKAALESYEKVMRPFIVEAQKLPAIGPGPLYIETEWGIWFANRVFGVMSALQIDRLLNRIMPEDKGGWIVPEYPELNGNT